MTTEGRGLGSDISELVTMKDTFVQPYGTVLCSLAHETADYAGRAKVKAVECHSRPVHLAPHKFKFSKRLKSSCQHKRFTISGHCFIPHSNCTPGNGETTRTLLPPKKQSQEDRSPSRF